MWAGKDVFQLFGIIRSNSRDIFRVGGFMTEHNLGKWHHVYDGHGKIFTINGQQIAMFSVDGKNLSGMLLDRFPAGLDFFSYWSDMGLYIASDLTTF